MEKKHSKLPMGMLILMASVTFMAMCSELVPSGILPLLINDLGLSESQAGSLVGWYAMASAICSIPLIRYTISWNRKKLLIDLMIGFALSNIVIGLVSNYWIIIICRVIGGICAGVLWPMISDYGMKTVDDSHQGQAVSIIMAGSTLGMSVGLPIMTFVGNNFGWRVEFITLGVISGIIAILCHLKLPSIEGESASSDNSPLTLIKNRGILVILLLTLLAVIGNYSVYTYITNLVDHLNYPSIEIAQVLFGIGSIISVVLSSRLIDDKLRQIATGLFLASAISYALFNYSSSNFIYHLGFLLWGIGFGALVSVYQTAVARQVDSSATSTATSLQSATFNFSIMIASSLGSSVLGSSGGMSTLLVSMVVVLIVGAVVSFSSKKVLK